MSFLLVIDFFLGFDRISFLTQKINGSKEGKTPNVKENMESFPLRLDSWINCKVKELGWNKP